ncbi:hypothetical protein T01_7647 [Trichinella spiralis]|uniref:Uncharacterized protein n=1 Tax=Trichinella spiralis TaxID=6334 RepID=A0A0V0Z7P4_TRISP|nr:hypothetical protein T01_7647 [Trichinella spiralis]
MKDLYGDQRYATVSTTNDERHCVNFNSEGHQKKHRIRLMLM